MSAIQGSGLEGVHNSGVWIRGVSAIQGSRLEGVCNSGAWIRGFSLQHILCKQTLYYGIIKVGILYII